VTRSLDYLGLGKLQYSDFILATLDRKKFLCEEILYDAFKFFDPDNTGQINCMNLKSAILQTGIDLD
jgi:calcium-dependent protein kinase